MAEAGLITMLFTDLVGSTELASDLGDNAADDLRTQHFADLREAIAATGGTEVKTIGDAVMVSYKGAADALAGGVAMQRAVERSGPTITDPNDLGLAMCAAALEQPDDADRHFADAIALCERAGARAYGARCHFFWAQVLADRGDASRAREQASIGIEMGNEMGLSGPHGVVVRGRAILDSLTL